MRSDMGPSKKAPNGIMLPYLTDLMKALAPSTRNLPIYARSLLKGLLIMRDVRRKCEWIR